MIAALLAEFIGSFVFFVVILATGMPLAIAAALLAAIYFGGHVSGGNFNPAVSVMMMLRGDLTLSTGLGYIFMQLLAAGVAFAWFQKTGKLKVRYA